MFISSGIAQVTLEEISVKSLPFIAISLVSIMIMVIFPQTVLWLPSLFGY
jgi:C4-dicarboxylate transporter DctM subunit